MRYRRRVLVWPAATALTAGCSGPPEPVSVDPAVHAAEVAAFARARVDELSAPDSWLSLIALHWIEEGATTMGSDPSNDLVLPEGKAEPFVGKAIRSPAGVRFVVAPGVEVTLGVDSTLNLPAGSGAVPLDASRNPPVTEVDLDASHGPGRYAVVRHGALSWIAVHRGERVALRVRDNTSEVYDTFDGIPRYDTDVRWRVTARWVPHTKTVAVPNVLGTVSAETSPAYLEFWVDGDRHTLDVTGAGDASTHMMVFGDETNGHETYGGGRYVWVESPDDQGRVVLDFNLAYNPPCVFTAFATCPLPTRDNRLPIAVHAGEKSWGHE